MIPAPKHRRLSRNTRGRDFFLGDLHGETEQFQEALERVRFDTEVDRVISVGDLADRGPDSLGALDLLREDWFFAVMGNHEVMLLSDDPGLQDVHFRSGGEWAFSLAEDDLAAARKTVSNLPYALTLEGPSGETIGVCHAEWPERDWARIETAVERQKIRDHMLWGRRRIKAGKAQQDRTADLLVHGHTPLEKPAKLGCALFIDTGATYGGYLTLMQLQDALTF